MIVPGPPKTPVLNRLIALQPEIRQLERFLCWLVSEDGGGVDLFRLPDGIWGKDFGNSSELFGAYFKIDRDALAAERQALIEYAQNLLKTP